MDNTLTEYKSILENDIKLLGYQQMRYSIFEGENQNLKEYQVRIEKTSSGYEVYTTADRASVTGKYDFTNIFEAMTKFLQLLQSMLLSNRRAVQQSKEPEYNCPLWSNLN